MKTLKISVKEDTYDLLGKVAGPGCDKPNDVIKRLCEKRLKEDLRVLVQYGAEYVYNHNWIGSCQSITDREIMRDRQKHIRRYFVKKFGKVKGKNLLKALERDVHVPAEDA
jgi:predicted CopG family antitoxin